MSEAISEDPWVLLHGPHEAPKKYIPPFLQQKSPTKGLPGSQDKDDGQGNTARMDNLYTLEIEEALERQRREKEDQSKARSRGIE